MWLVDLDEYRQGPFTVEVDRLPGSDRYMAPEEWERGATIDERTTVFNLGRAEWCCSTRAKVGEAFRGTPTMAACSTTRRRPIPPTASRRSGS